MTRPLGILRQDSRNRKGSPSDRLGNDDPSADTLIRLLRRVGEEQQPENSVLMETLRQVAQSIHNENLAKLVNNYLRSRRSRILSYDNFFRALTEFRNKMSGSMDTTWALRAASERDECSSTDLETFDALVDLVGKIAEYDESARLHMADNPDWNHPIHVLVGLISCAIPTTMKATVLRTLAAFAKSSGSALLVWQYIDGARILTSLTVTGPIQKPSLKQEMEDKEVHCREFPLTRALILLISRIFDGVTAQAMGPDILQQFQDFSNYIYFTVFLKADERSFSTPQEHLDVLIACLSLFETNLKSLNDMSIIFVPAMTTHPGYILRQRILEGGAFFEKLVNWLIVCIDENGKVHSDAVRQKLEEVVVCILSVFKSVIVRHDEFLKLLHQNDHNAVAAGFHVITGPGPHGRFNARTARRDLIFVFMRLLKFKDIRHSIAQFSMELIDFITRRVEDQREWITILYFDEALYQEIMKYFCACLQLDPADSPQPNQSFELTDSAKLVQQSLRMILGNLKLNEFPNLAHVLLGFPVRNGFVEPVLGSEAISFAIGRVVELVEPGMDLYALLPTVTELALDIVDCLCQHQKTGTVVLGFIRFIWTGDLSVQKMVQQLPLVDPNDSKTFSYLRHQKALLHIIAKEIRILTEEYKTQSAVELISALGDFPRGPDTPAPVINSMFVTPDRQAVQASLPLLIRLLSVAEVVIPILEPVGSLSLELLDVSNVEDALNAARLTAEDGLVLHDASETLLYIRELLKVHEENGMGRSDVVQDFKTVCDYIEKEAFLVGLVRARRECYEAWSILVGAVAESCPTGAFSYPIIPTFFLGLANLLTSRLVFGTPSTDALQVFEVLFSIVTAFVRFTSPPKVSMSILEALRVDGYATECVKMDYKSVIVRTKGHELSSLLRNLATLILKPTVTIFNRRGYYSVLLMLLKFADWNYDGFEDASLAYAQSIQDAASSLRGLYQVALTDHLEGLLRVLQNDGATERGSDEGIIVQVLSRLASLNRNVHGGGGVSRLNFDLIPSLLASLPKDNQSLTECIAAQTDVHGALAAFETKFDILTTWISSPGSLPADPEEISTTFQLAIRAVLQFDVVRILPLIKDTRNSISSVQRAVMTGTYNTVYGYCMTVFRKIVDFLIAVLRQVRLRPAHRDAMFRTYKYIEKYGLCFSDCLQEPTDAEDPAWDDICRTTELTSLVNHNFFTRELSNPASLDLSPEMLAIEIKLGRLLHNLGNLVVKAPKGNYSEYYQDFKRRSHSVQLVRDLVTYLRRLMFETGSDQVNLLVIRPIFTRSQIMGRKVSKTCCLAEMARGTVTVSYGDLLEHIRTFSGVLMSRVKSLENIRYAVTQSAVGITETDLQVVLDSEYLPSRREDKQNFYKLFLKEQERDICVDLRQLLNIVECLVMILVTHLEYAFAQFLEESDQPANSLPASMRRALLPALEQDNPSRALDRYHHFKLNVRDFITDDFVRVIQDVYQKIGAESNDFLGLFIVRLRSLVTEASC